MREFASSWDGNNARLGVASILLRLEDHFLQLIEGPPRAVSTLMESIWDDPRHTDLQILQTARDSQNYADGHPLAYVDLNSDKGSDSGALKRFAPSLGALSRESPPLRDWLASKAHAHPLLLPGSD